MFSHRAPIGVHAQPRTEGATAHLQRRPRPHSVHPVHGSGLLSSPSPAQRRPDNGYGLLLAFDDHNGDEFTAGVDDVDYVRLLGEASVGIAVPADKITHVLHGWPDLRPRAATVWP